MAQQTINPGSPPIVWSTVDDAFTKINANFDEIYATIGGALGSVVDFASLSSNVSPSATETYDLGSPSFRWRDLYLAGSSLYLGSALITADGAGVVNLPAGSTVNGELIRNPEEASFKNIAVSGQGTIAADLYTDTLTFDSGNAGITLTTNTITDTVTITNSGILSVAGTASQIGASTVAGVTTLTNLGVLSLTGETGGIAVSAATGNVTITNLGVKRLIAGSGIGITPAGGTGTITIENTLPASPTFRTIRVDGDFINQVQADPGNFNDILNMTSGPGMTITADPATDTLTFTVNSNLDIKGSVFGFDSSLIVDGTSGNITGQTISAAVAFQGNLLGNLTGHVVGSVFADNSTMLVDGTSATVVGNINSPQIRTSESSIALGLDTGAAGLNTIAIGEQAGQYTQGNRALAIGFQAGLLNQGVRGIAIGQAAGNSNQGANGIAIGETAGAYNQGIDAIAIGQNAAITGQGDNAIAIGRQASGTSQGANAIAIGRSATGNNQTAGSIVLNATGTNVSVAAAGFFVDPLRSSTTSARPIVYDTTTKELKYTSTLEFINSTISTSDSSSITVDVTTSFNSDVVVENDLTVAERLTVKGSRVINLTELKTVVAASTDFADFQARIAALS